ncbi:MULTISPECIES: DUF6289 family protein [unclassified Lysobacter]|uniref:DUF6289 family protein n=1 Tax=unclassified Lysobacter TaxID=2635362 RepID=UPI001BE9B6E7|nr:MULTISPECIES: DUF6289 family protein [unclassified Lysobacter]MBT2749087.1 hypothetical protein [Lysobacter sp. ISL-42]MBT2751401.1 hypothetical protein [Lysobacter sp. ISL-50]MBT2777343.1 hypothetical protein [Lysobacter sp. ISL-54]MBT2781581.1 hypothetical protein [Lysobacter sp. ISL-52]
MSEVTQSSKRKLSLILLAAGMAVSLAAAALPHAGPGQGYVFIYYSDASHSEEVGGMGYGHCGEPFNWGTRTRYFTYAQLNCNPNP